jgi:D-sedoheptulose 7-phosphate isomerase
MKKNHTKNFFDQTIKISKLINKEAIENLVSALINLRNKNGRIFFLGVGGSAANSSHAVNDFRKICNIECYCPTDNVSELSARINDEGWDSSFVEWLKVSKLNSKDAIFIFSVGGGNVSKNVSINLVKSIDYAKKINAKIFGVVGRDGGYTKKKGDNIIIVPEVDKNMVTPYSEAFQAVVWHCLVSHPLLKKNKTKW